jgi:periplasmic protein TonB
MTDAYIDGFTEFEPETRTLAIPLSPLDQVSAGPGHARWIGGLGATAIHAAVALAAWALAANAGAARMQPVPITQMIEVPVELEPAPLAPPPPVAVPEPEPTPPKELKALPRPREPVPRAAPAAAETAKLLTQEPPPEEVVDFGETFVQGNAVAYAGGVSASTGSSRQAVRDTAARATGIVGGTGTDERSVDRSRVPALAGGAQWNCPFPREAEFDGIDSAVVTLNVRVSDTGSVEDVSVKQDPGSGFGREAKRCALSKRWAPGLDRAGNAVAMSAQVHVRFIRSN